MDVGWGAGDVEGEVYVVGLLGDEGGVEGGYAIGMGTVAILQMDNTLYSYLRNIVVVEQNICEYC